MKKITSRVSTRDFNCPGAPISRIAIFKGRRLPLLENNSTDVAGMRLWIGDAAEMGALRKSEDETFSDCLGLIKTYLFVNGRRGYIVFPVWRPRKSSDTQLISAERTSGGLTSNEDETPQLMASSVTGQFSTPERVAINEPSSPQPALADLTDEPGLQGPEVVRECPNSSTGNESDMFSSSPVDPLMTEACRILEAAQDDNVFSLLSHLFDDNTDYKVEFFAGALLQGSTSGQLEVDPLMHDILLYSHWKIVKVQNAIEHEQRARRLRTTLEIFRDVRELYGLSLTPQRSWSYR